MQVGLNLINQSSWFLVEMGPPHTGYWLHGSKGINHCCWLGHRGSTITASSVKGVNHYRLWFGSLGVNLYCRLGQGGQPLLQVGSRGIKHSYMLGESEITSAARRVQIDERKHRPCGVSCSRAVPCGTASREIIAACIVGCLRSVLSTIEQPG